MSWLDTLDEVRTRDFSKASKKEREKAAREVINICSYAVIAARLIPVPLANALVPVSIQAAMVVTIGHVYGRKVTKKDAGRLVAELGTVAGASVLMREGLKRLVPFLGLLTLPAIFAGNWALGRMAMAYFEDPDAPRERLRTVYAKARKEGEGLFSKVKLGKFRRRGAEADAAPAATAAPPKRKPAAKKARRARPARRATP